MIKIESIVIGYSLFVKNNLWGLHEWRAIILNPESYMVRGGLLVLNVFAKQLQF
jgi:hypothetical protein